VSDYEQTYSEDFVKDLVTQRAELRLSLSDALKENERIRLKFREIHRESEGWQKECLEELCSEVFGHATWLSTP